MRFTTKGQRFKNAPLGCLRKMLLIFVWCDDKEWATNCTKFTLKKFCDTLLVTRLD